jgi:tetratricopeptide (TPR) repeat protein
LNMYKIFFIFTSAPYPSVPFPRRGQGKSLRFHPLCFCAFVPLYLLLIFSPFQISDFKFQVSYSFAASHDSVPKEITDLIARGKKEEAKKAIDQFRRKDPDNPLAIFYLAQVTDDGKKAMALYKEVEILADRSLASEAAFARAELNFYHGDVLEARNIYEKIVTQYSSSLRYTDALYRLGMTSLATGDEQKALATFRKCRDTDKNEYRKTLAEAGIMECYVAMKDWNHALESARKVMEGRDDGNALTPRVLEVTVLAWRELGNEENAVKFTQRLTSNFPRSYQAHALRERGNRIETASNSFNAQKVNTDSVRSLPGELQKGQNTVAGDTTIISGSAANYDSDEVGSEFSIQAAAFEDRFNSLRLYDKLKGAGFPARVEMKTVGSKHFYLVRVGSFSTRQEADKMSEQVSKVTGSKASVIVVK